MLLLAGRSRGSDSYRGIFRLLSEEHIPFAVSDNMDWLGKREFDLVIATDWAPAGLQRYVERGRQTADRVGARRRTFAVAPVVRTATRRERICPSARSRAFPSLTDTDLLMLNGPFTDARGRRAASLTLVPPSMIGPPENVHVDMRDTGTPAIVSRNVGKGTVAWMPWDLGALYYRQSLPAHAGLFHDVVDAVVSAAQLTTNAHPLVEMTLMQQGGRTLMHLINLADIRRRDISRRCRCTKFVWSCWGDFIMRGRCEGRWI